MSIRRLTCYLFLAFLILIMSGMPIESRLAEDTQPATQLIAGRNVNMVSGTRLPLGDPWLQRQNEPSIAVSSRNPMHLFAAANDYRTIDMSDDYEVRGIPGVAAIRDAWIGIFEFFDGGESPVTMLLPGFPQDTSNEGLASPIHGFDTACDPIVRAGARGLFYLSGIAFNRSQKAGVVFVARYVDRNNREKIEEIVDPVSGRRKYVGPIEYMDTRLVDAGNPGQFIDMPNMAVDVPRSGAPGNVYLAYTVFLGNTDINVRSRVVFVKSTDGGISWSKQIRLTETQHIIQRPVIFIDPSDSTGRTIYVTFRRFAFGNTPGGIVFVKSIDGGLSFSRPADVATLLYPFDQWTKGTPTTSSRTNSYPTMAVDGNGVPWVVWAQRYDQNGMPSPDGQSRIVFSYSMNGGIIWSSPAFVDPLSPGEGHQFMPSITCAGGIKTVIWYDQRDDIALPSHDSNNKFIEDGGDHRHTIDVRAAEAPASSPVFEPSILVSRYLYYMQLGDNGEPVPFADGSLVMQGQYNFLGLPLFWLGTKPFHGDYMEVVSSPQILPPPATGNSWAFNTNPAEPTSSHGVWTDTRDVWPPEGNLWGNWINYNPPTSIQDTDFEQENPCNNIDTTGMRNQNVYTATLNHGVIVGSPGNTKQLDIQRTFVVFIKNTTEYSKSLSLTIYPSSGVPASFEKITSKPSLDVTVPPYSSVSCTAYVGPSASNNGFGSVIVDITKGTDLVGRVYLNPDSTNNPLLDPYDPSGGTLEDEHHNPRISNPKVWKYDVGNKNEPNPTFLSPRAQNPRAQNSGYVNPRAQNQGIINPRAQNPRAQNPRAQNENIVNNEMENPRAQNPRAQNTALTDMTWTVTNDGNTTSAYTFNLTSTMADYFNADPPPLIAQVLVYKVHTVPIDNECALGETHVDELLVNVTNPRAQNPRAQNVNPTSRRFTTLATTAAEQDFDDQDVTFFLAPGEEADVTLRVYDPDINDPIAFDTTIVAGETVAEAPNTGQTEPEYAEQPNIPWVNPLPAIVADPISLSFNTDQTDSEDLYLSLSGLAGGEPLEYSLSVDLPDDQHWLSITQTTTPPIGKLDGSPLAHTVNVDDSDLDPGSYVGSIWVHVPGASNNPLRIPVYLTAGAAPVPEVEVTYTYGEANNVLIDDRETFPFGVENLGSSSEGAIFKIKNVGYSDLLLGGSPIINIYGTDASQFRVDQQGISPKLPPGGSTTFTLRFAPTSVGPKTASISIMNNDLNENPFDILLQGTCGATSAQLVAYYPFNGNANDASGNGNDGTVSGAILTADRFGNPDRAYQFDGVDDGIVVADSATLDITHSITMTAWIKPDSGGTAGQYVVQKRELTQGGSVYTLDIYPGTVRSLYRYEGGGTATRYATGSTSIVADQWQQVAATWDGSTITVYINGQPDGTASFTHGPIQTSTGDLEIGHYTGGWRYFDGCIDDVRIYNGALSPTEIQQLYQQESVQSLGLVAYYPFNGNANDESGNGNHGTVNGATLTTDRFGNPARAYEFNGDTSFIEVPDSSSLDFMTGMTVTAWVEPDANNVNLPIVTKYRSEDPLRSFFLYGWTSGTQGPRFRVQTDGLIGDAATTELLSTSGWSFVVGTYNRTSAKLYVNGVEKAANSATGTINLNNLTLKIGGDNELTASFFDGKIDDVRVYDIALSTIQVQQLYAQESLPMSGLVAHYPFSGNANDASGNGNDGTVYGGAGYGQDRFGNPNGALVFDGVDDYVSLPNENNFDLTTWSIAAMVKVPDYTRINPVVSKGQEYGNYTIDITPTTGWPYVTFQVSGGDETHPLAAEAVTPGQYVHVAATYNGSTRQLKGYLNGVPKVTITTGGTPLLNDGIATIGLSTFISAPARYFIGDIDDIRIYNRVLTATEIAILAAH
jgi:hypothetical protein